MGTMVGILTRIERSFEYKEFRVFSGLVIRGHSFGGPRVAFRGLVNEVSIVITDIRRLFSPLFTTHEPSSKPCL